MTLPSSPARTLPLDALRFLAALAVVLFHYTYKGELYTGLRPEPLSQVTRYGGFGVDLFFVISGFVILGSAEGKTPYQFVVSRVTRILPAFLLAVLSTFTLVRLFGPPALQVEVSDLLVNLSTVAITPAGRALHVPLVDPVYWTLAIETQFYLLVLVALLLGLMRRVRALLYGWLVLSAALQGLTAVFGDLAALDLLGQVLLRDWSAYFVAGGLFSLQASGRGRRSDVVALAGAFVLNAAQSWGRAAYNNAHELAGFTPWAVTLAVASIYLVFALIAFRTRPLGWLAAWAPLGRATYPLYLLHANLGYVVLIRLRPYLPGEVSVPLTVLLFVGLAFLVQRYVERPVSRWMKRALLRGPAAP